jgi:hypothetical protein
MRDLLLNPPEVSPWNSTGLFHQPKIKKKQNKSAAWSGQRVKIQSGIVAPSSSSDPSAEMTEEEMEEARQAARAEARAKRRAAAIAMANCGMSIRVADKDFVEPITSEGIEGSRCFD